MHHFHTGVHMTIFRAYLLDAVIAVIATNAELVITVVDGCRCCALEAHTPLFIRSLGE
jgi:hypothetical protein